MLELLLKLCIMGYVETLLLRLEMSKNESKLEAKLKRGHPKVVHGAYSFIASGKLPEHRVYLLRYLSGARQGLIDDLGGEESLSTAQIILIDRITSKLGCVRCIEEHIRENGVFLGQELSPVLKASYLAYSNSLRLDLLALGIERRNADETLTPFELVQKEEREKRKE